MPEIEGAGVALHYDERGSGSPLLIVHGIGSDAVAWEPARDELAAAGTRAIAYDRRGYGASGAPEPYAATTVQEQSEDAAALLAALDAAPAMLVGDGFGALVVLELLVRRPELASGAVLGEPSLFAFVAAAAKPLADERSLLEEALREGGPGHAIAAWLGDAADGDRIARASAARLGFFADYAGRSSWSPSRGELRAIAVPVAIVTRPDTPAHVVEAADAAARLIPGAHRSGDGDVVGAALLLLDR